MTGVLNTANQAFQKCETILAMSGYVDALLKMPELGNVIAGNISRTRKQYLNSRKSSQKLKVVVCGWELAHNAAGRAHTLAEIYREITRDVEILGSIFPNRGREIWEPIRETTIPIHAFVVKPNHFIEQALNIVAAHPADLVHLSKPRAPNIIFGIFYKLIWEARVIVDIDDEELAFVKAKKPMALCEYLQEYPSLPPLDLLAGAHWTRLAVGLVNDFDAITVSNKVLQRRYGGEVIAHARDPRVFNPSKELRKTSRKALGIQEHQKVVLFLGTPRAHKGLLQTAIAIQSLRRSDVVFAIVGSFENNNLKLKEKLMNIKGVNYLFLENQPIGKLPSMLSIADCCVLFQSIDNPVSEYQIPAKLSDALAMEIPVLASPTPTLCEAIDAGAVTEISESNISKMIGTVLIDSQEGKRQNPKKYFNEVISLDANSVALNKLIIKTSNRLLTVDLLQLLHKIKMRVPYDVIKNIGRVSNCRDSNC